MTLWIVERWIGGDRWEPVPVWSATVRAHAFAKIAGLVENAHYSRRHLRVKAWVRAVPGPSKAEGEP